MPTNRIDSIHIEGIPPISDAMDLTLNPRVNLLIGPNGCGKSTVLRTIIASLKNPECWSGSPLSNRSVQLELQHELREIASARVQLGRPDRSVVSDYHDHQFQQSAYDYEYFITRGWLAYVERENDVPPHLKIPFVYIPATRLPFPRKDDIVSAYVLSEDTVSDNVFDSRRAFRNMERFENPNLAADRASMTDEEFRKVEMRTSSPDESFDEWESNVLWPKLRDAASARKDALLETMITCAARICSDILKPETLSEHSHSTESGLQAERGIQQVGYAHWRPHTYDRSDEPMTIGELSAGTQGPLMWIWHLVAELHDFFVATHRRRLTHHRYRRIRQFVHYVSEDGQGNEWLTPEQYAENGSPPGYAERSIPGLTEESLSWEEYRDQGAPLDYCADPTPLPDEAPDEWRRMPFILLIDEIENHLHPAWQRRVIPALLETFPRMQLIATTHSPFVVAGRKAGQVHRMFRNEAGLVRAETSDEDIVGWTVEDILRAFMEVADPTDEDTAVAAAVLRWLREQEPEEGMAAEDWRQARISELSGTESQSSMDNLVALGWLERLPTLSGAALEWWEDQIEHLDEQVSPNLEFQGRAIAERARYIAELEEILSELAERSGEDLLDD